MAEEVERKEERPARKVSGLALANLGIALAALLLACIALAVGALNATRPVRVSVEVAYPTPAPTIPAAVSAPEMPAAPARQPTPPSATTGIAPPPRPVLTMEACTVLSASIWATFTVHTSAPVAVFFEVPVATDGRVSVPADAQSLEQARFAELQRVTAGTATFSLSFPTEGLDARRPWLIVFNPSRGEDDPVAPRFSFVCGR